MQVIRGYLESNGVDCLVADSHAGTFDGSVMIGGFRLLVPADQAARAQLLVKDVTTRAKAAAETCPRCGSGDVESGSRPLGAVIGWLLGRDMPDRYGLRYCRNCDHRWQRD